MASPAAFFDLDKTVLRIDSGTSYMQFQRMRGDISALEMARVLWWGVQYRLALLDVETMAERVAMDYAGDPEAEMIARCRVWYESFVAPAILDDARRAIDRHRDLGHEVVILTGSTQYCAVDVAAALGVEHTLCTLAEVDGGRFTGKLRQLCFGRHKVGIAERFAAERDIDLDASLFYSDSYNDIPMLSRVGTPIAVNPDARLLRHARRSGWRIERWA
jgi:HAD superfamily hydrolase (TIGR01490 family)